MFIMYSIYRSFFSYSVYFLNKTLRRELAVFFKINFNFLYCFKIVYIIVVLTKEVCFLEPSTHVLLFICNKE